MKIISSVIKRMLSFDSSLSVYSRAFAKSSTCCFSRCFNCSTSTIFALFQVSWTVVLLSLLYFILGYLLFAGLMAGTGILGNSPQESGQLSAFWTLLSMIPMFLVAPISEEPNAWLARGLSYFPLTAPVTMLMRITSAQVPWVDVGISVTVLIISIYFAVVAAAKLFRAAALMYGKRPSLGEIFRWLREA